MNELQMDQIAKIKVIGVGGGGCNAVNRMIEEGVKTLKEVAAKIDTTKMKEPSFLMVLTGTSPYAYQREDGVYIVPITALKN